MLAPRSARCVSSEASAPSTRVEGPLSDGIALVPFRNRSRLSSRLGVGVDVAAGQLDAIADRPAYPHPCDGDVDVVVFDALPARERQAVRRIEAIGVVGPCMPHVRLDAAILLLDEEAGAERGELGPDGCRRASTWRCGARTRKLSPPGTNTVEVPSPSRW